MPYAPTHRIRASSTRLDLYIIDDLNKLISYDQQDVNFLLAHDLIHFEYNLKIKRIWDCSIWIKDLRSFDSECFLHELSSCDWNILFCL